MQQGNAAWAPMERGVTLSRSPWLLGWCVLGAEAQDVLAIDGRVQELRRGDRMGDRGRGGRVESGSGVGAREGNVAEGVSKSRNVGDSRKSRGSCAEGWHVRKWLVEGRELTRKSQEQNGKVIAPPAAESSALEDRLRGRE